MIININDVEYNMNYIERRLNIESLIKRKSLFLVGPRLVGKSTYVNQQLKSLFALSWSLLDGKLRMQVQANPSLLREEVIGRSLSDCAIFIDEIQKCPSLLDEIHYLIESRNIRFLLTGSSLYKLRKGGVNLLGGRASIRKMGVLSYIELKSLFNPSLKQIMKSGMLPSIFLSENSEEDLSSYIDAYLTEEIAAEGAVRNLSNFSRFLTTAALTNTQSLNYVNVARDAQLPPQTVKNWYQILFDTLIAFEVPAFLKTEKRKAFSTGKFYLFDVGIARLLKNAPVPNEESIEFGQLFEQFIAIEIKTFLECCSPRSKLSYWRSISGFEVDFVIDQKLAIEVKATKVIHQKHLKGLQALREENIFSRYIVVSLEERVRNVDGIEIWPWSYFLEKLWDNEKPLL
jgi:predicted AAA+ superfamily ATPase